MIESTFSGKRIVVTRPRAQAKELQRAIEELGAFENARSGERRSLFDQIDALTAELVKRYKDDGANIDALLNDES